MVDTETIKTHIRHAINVAVEELLPTINRGDLAGLALGTDDDVGSLFAISCSKRWVATNGVEMGLQFNEWPDYLAEDAFNAASRQLFKLSTSPGVGDREWARMRDQVFDLIVQELERAKNQHGICGGVFLCVGSTDPSDHLLNLELTGVRRLNSNAIIKAYEQLMAEWA